MELEQQARRGGEGTGGRPRGTRAGQGPTRATGSWRDDWREGMDFFISFFGNFWILGFLDFGILGFFGRTWSSEG